MVIKKRKPFNKALSLHDSVANIIDVGGYNAELVFLAPHYHDGTQARSVRIEGVEFIRKLKNFLDEYLKHCDEQEKEK